jgi:hypothetical protein
MSEKNGTRGRIGGWAGWLADTLRQKREGRRRLQLVERIALGPRQSLVLVEAEGRRILVATSAEGGPAFYPLDGRGSAAGGRREPGAKRVSW